MQFFGKMMVTPLSRLRRMAIGTFMVSAVVLTSGEKGLLGN